MTFTKIVTNVTTGETWEEELTVEELDITK